MNETTTTVPETLCFHADCQEPITEPDETGDRCSKCHNVAVAVEDGVFG